MQISAIIPAFQESAYIKQCLDSLHVDEVLVGIDGCEDTLDTLQHIELPENVRVFWMEHSGPYVVRNTLAEIASGDALLFFDADDWMLDGSVGKIDTYLTSGFDIVYYEYVWSWARDYYEKMRERDEVCKPFEHYNRPHIDLNNGGANRRGRANGSGTFAIHADCFEGFMPWPCGADTEYLRRTARRKKTRIQDVIYVRRRHMAELTTSGETRLNMNGHGSKRKEARDKLRKCRAKIRRGDYSYVPDPIVTTEYREVDCD